MIIRHVAIRRFRGVRSLDWAPDGSLVCLIGPGDSMKTTILDAIELALLPRSYVSLDDHDFYNADTSEPIGIVVTVGDLPERLVCDSKFGLVLRGWNSTAGLHDEPNQEGDEPVLSVRLTIDESLEPSWTVINDRLEEGRPISARDRESLGVTRLGELSDRHLTWGRGSALLRLTGATDEISRILTEATRTARADFKLDGTISEMTETMNLLEDLCRPFDVYPMVGYEPGLNFDRIASFVLMDGDIPVSRLGLGSKRLLTLALHHYMLQQGAIVLIDEIETGLEPHRLRRLIRLLRPSADQAVKSGQTITTTHSSVAIQELRASELRVVRAEDGALSIKKCHDDLQSTLRACSEAFLGRQVIVCEGSTEEGFCRGLEQYWTTHCETEPFSCKGVVLADGKGDNAPARAVHFTELGYRAALLMDSDKKETRTKVGEAEEKGVQVFQWPGEVSIEERIFYDILWEDVLCCLSRVSEYEKDVTGQVKARYSSQRVPLDSDRKYWKDSRELRKAIGKAAKENNWFKRIDRGEILVFTVARSTEAIPDSDTGRMVRDLRSWVEQEKHE